MNSIPPSYEQVIAEEPGGSARFCFLCGFACSPGHIYCFQCGTVIGNNISIPGAVPQPIYEPPPIYVPPSYPKPPPVVAKQPKATSAEAHVQPYNALNDMSVRIGDRLIYDFEKVACCIGEVTGLDPLVKDNIHPDVNRKGVSPQEWRVWMTELDDIQRKAASVVGCLCIFCFPGCFPQAILCAMLCPTSMDHPLSWLPCCYGDWYAALRKWMAKVNNTLMKYDMCAKLVTYKPFNNAPRSKRYSERSTGKDHNYEMSFLIIALTSQESSKLQRESWDHGVNDKCTSGIGRCL